MDKNYLSGVRTQQSLYQISSKSNGALRLDSHGHNNETEVNNINSSANYMLESQKLYMGDFSSNVDKSSVKVQNNMHNSTESVTSTVSDTILIESCVAEGQNAYAIGKSVEVNLLDEKALLACIVCKFHLVLVVESGLVLRIDIGDEQSDLLRYEVFSGKLILDKGKAHKSSKLESSKEVVSQDAVEAKLTSKAMDWGSDILHQGDVSHCPGLRHFTIHSYSLGRGFLKTGRSQKEICFLASTSEEALIWVNASAYQQCYVYLFPYPLASSKKQASDDMVTNEFPPESYVRCKYPPKRLVILNPRSGRGRSSKVFHRKVEHIFKVLCVGGDRIVNEGIVYVDNGFSKQ
ncbi:hypothetical protein CQW23_12485 [Capsicum baccatum]|uniref:DAGKc domain-containing protein n=1 Tax=Capsicum baccatum TaxID=33114 RepID=A0A2G2WSR2_CAPBA|nr:hypothetical protein CQW23_12485 [Capsicum baccatum]